ncbi:hypothetical protein [Halomontanus rarus]|nr:hypothetical protein [Halovivax sp. KZCA124]
MSSELTDDQKYHWYCPGCRFNPENYDPDGDINCPECGTEMSPPQKKYT